nr:hypothetical protein StreXyl84_14970 [Streptomyces sp. Xyl84]
MHAAGDPGGQRGPVVVEAPALGELDDVLHVRLLSGGAGRRGTVRAESGHRPVAAGARRYDATNLTPVHEPV